MTSFPRRAALLLLLALSIAPAARAAEEEQPLEITADQTLEWQRETKQYVARGNAIAKQGDTTVSADTLLADYQEKDGGGIEILRVTAEGKVRIASPDGTAEGEQGVYDLKTGVATLTGSALKMTTADGTVTAKDRFEYHAQEHRAVAIGNARIVHDTDTLDADQVTAFFAAEDPAKPDQRTMSSAEATGNVVITTPDEVLKGDHGTYDRKANTARLNGHVTITRSPNVLEGSAATVDLTTKISRMEGGKGERVRGIFYPGSEKKKEAVKTDAPSPQKTP